jgi:hypothetical protein
VIEIAARGWTADWLVGWLAAIGVVQRGVGVKLRWSSDPMPYAIFRTPNEAAIEATWPSLDELQSIAIARELPGLDYESFDRNPSRGAYAARARMARATGDLSLGATVSDLGVAASDPLEHSPLDAAAPRGITLGQRVVSAHGQAPGGAVVVESMRGRVGSSAGNGLGFDLRRLSGTTVPGANLATEPVAETMAFFGLQLFTQSGRATRGWKPSSQYLTGAFSWPAWNRALGWHAIDALLDRYYAGQLLEADLVAGLYSVAYRPTGASDTTRGYAGVLQD